MRWILGPPIDAAPGAWFIPKIHINGPGCPRPSIALQCRMVAKHYAFHLVSKNVDVSKTNNLHARMLSAVDILLSIMVKYNHMKIAL